MRRKRMYTIVIVLLLLLVVLLRIYIDNEIPKVSKIFGPGNQYVTAAKQYAQQLGLAIDLPAGPSEFLVIADATCEPEFVAADLLSQAEHGGDSQVILVTNSKRCSIFVKLPMLSRILSLRNSKTLATMPEAIEL